MSENRTSSHRVSGEVTFANLMALRAEGEAVIRSTPGTVRMQLDELDGGSSAAVALLMAWFRSATAQGKAIELIDVPARVQKIIELSGLTDVLPLVQSGAAASRN